MAIDTLTLAMISARALLVGRRRTKEDSIGGENLDPEVSEEIARLVRERLEADTTGASTLTAAEEDPKNPHRQQLLQDALVDVVVMDDVFAGKLAALVSKVDGPIRQRTLRHHKWKPGLTTLASRSHLDRLRLCDT